MKSKIKNKKAFTLIELLVVVIIIGVLAAIALPQYRRAMLKTESTQMLVDLQVLHQAQQNFYFFSEKYAENFDTLEVAFKDFSREKCGEAYTGAGGYRDIICNDKYLLVMATSYGLASGALFKDGPYKKCGFRIQEEDDARIPTKEILCIDRKGLDFCTNIWHCSFYKLVGTAYYYNNCKL